MRNRNSQAGLTLMEVMIAVFILVAMMTLAWKTITTTNHAKVSFEEYELRNHEIRMAMRRTVADLEAAYLSQNDDPNYSSTTPRTMFVARSGDEVPDIKFSTLGHRSLWADANESDQTVISYETRRNPEHSDQTDVIRREQRRLSNENPETVPAEYDVLLTNVEKIQFLYWNWKNQEWQDTWDTMQADGQKNQLPSRVKITITIKDEAGHEQKFVSQARIAMSEPLNFVQ